MFKKGCWDNWILDGFENLGFKVLMNSLDECLGLLQVGERCDIVVRWTEAEEMILAKRDDDC